MGKFAIVELDSKNEHDEILQSLYQPYLVVPTGGMCTIFRDQINAILRVFERKKLYNDITELHYKRLTAYLSSDIFLRAVDYSSRVRSFNSFVSEEEYDDLKRSKLFFSASYYDPDDIASLWPSCDAWSPKDPRAVSWPRKCNGCSAIRKALVLIVECVAEVCSWWHRAQMFMTSAIRPGGKHMPDWQGFKVAPPRILDILQIRHRIEANCIGGHEYISQIILHTIDLQYRVIANCIVARSDIHRNAVFSCDTIPSIKISFHPVLMSSHDDIRDREMFHLNMDTVRRTVLENYVDGHTAKDETERQAPCAYSLLYSTLSRPEFGEEGTHNWRLFRLAYTAYVTPHHEKISLHAFQLNLYIDWSYLVRHIKRIQESRVCIKPFSKVKFAGKR
jgi:autonomous glycyl radical cofactor GrcA